MFQFPPFYSRFIHQDDVIPKLGCPLESHPNWSLITGSTSKLCWDNYGRDVIVNDGGSTSAFVSLTPELNAAVLKGYYDPIVTGNDNYVLPFAKYSKGDMVGCRINNGQLQVIQRTGGTWKTIAAIPIVSGGFFSVTISDYKIVISIDGLLVLDQDHNVAGPGYFGVLDSNWSSGSQILVSGYRYDEVVITQTPCMTGYTSPYGEVSASSEWDGYPAYLGMNCHSNNGGDCWVSGSGETLPQWIQWIAPPEQPMIDSRKIVYRTAHNLRRSQLRSRA